MLIRFSLGIQNGQWNFLANFDKENWHKNEKKLIGFCLIHDLISAITTCAVQLIHVYVLFHDYRSSSS